MIETIEKKLHDILDNFILLSEQDILKGNFEILLVAEHCIKIRVLNEIVNVWNVDEQDTFLYSLDMTEQDTIYFPRNRLNKPNLVRDILRSKAFQIKEEQIKKQILTLSEELRKGKK
jgi:hypothetical protein